MSNPKMLDNIQEYISPGVKRGKVLKSEDE
jgi:hypothetical protein